MEVRRDGLVFDVRQGGPSSGEVVLLLHGFPQTSESWDDVVPLLHEGGLRTVAPDQRGYSPRARPKGRGAYRSDELVADALAVADAAEAERVHVVGHDWGGAVAWALAARHPDRVRTLTSLSTPHPAAMRRAVLTSTQALQSVYVAFFQLPDVPERLLLAGGGRGLRRALVSGGLAEATADRYVAHMRAPGALTAALSWYRAVSLRDTSLPAVRVATLYVWSTRDMALGRAAAEGTRAFVEAPYRFEVLEGVSHWIPEERPETVARLVLEHVGSATSADVTGQRLDDGPGRRRR